MKLSVKDSKKAMTKGNLTEAQQIVTDMTRNIKRAHVKLVEGLKEDPLRSFERRSQANLLPAQVRQMWEVRSVIGFHSSMLTFHAEQRSIMTHVSNLRELSNKIEHAAAADMMVRFDAEVSLTRRSIGDFLVLARRHLRARTDALKLMQQAISPQTCKTSAFVQQVGKTLAKMNNAEQQHIKALTKSWRDAAASLERIADLLVDGGLLLHYVRLVTTMPLNTTLCKNDL